MEPSVRLGFSNTFSRSHVYCQEDKHRHTVRETFVDVLAFLRTFCFINNFVVSTTSSKWYDSNARQVVKIKSLIY